MAAAGAPARPLPTPSRPEGEPRRVRSPQGRPAGARAVAPRRRLQALPARLLVFVVLLAVLGFGRVALSFAVVQKNLQTDAVSRQYHVVQAQNQRLAETAANLSSALAVRNAAVTKYHLVVSPDVQFITVHPGRLRTHKRH
jgi:cell division protein FtsB